MSAAGEAEERTAPRQMKVSLQRARQDGIGGASPRKGGVMAKRLSSVNQRLGRVQADGVAVADAALRYHLKLCETAPRP